MGRLSFWVGAVMIAFVHQAAIAADDQGAETPPIASETMKPPESERMICKREPVMGSHMTRRVCRTRSQMEAERDAAQELLRTVGDDGSMKIHPSEGG